MRVISGKYRGRKLQAPLGDNTRPTLDRTKETIFNMIQHDIVGANCLDLFAGSGQIGIELISRGANHVTFVDNNRASVQCVKDNLKQLAVDEKQYYLFNANYRDCISSKKVYDLVYLDPPFASGIYVEVITALDDSMMISEGGVVVCESSLNENLPEKIGEMIKTKERKVGSVLFTIYRKEQL